MTPLRRDWVKRIIDRLDIAHNGKLTAWVRDGQAEPMLALWAEKLAGLDADDIKRGLASAERAEKPPTPQQFRSLCARPPAHQPYQALPAPEVSAEQAAGNLRAVRDAAKKQTMRRCLYRKGYGRSEHDAALSVAKSAGLPFYLADMRAMSHNGWREADEAATRVAWAALPGRCLVCSERSTNRMALYQPHHEPPDWVLHNPDPSAVDRWIETGEQP